MAGSRSSQLLCACALIALVSFAASQYTVPQSVDPCQAATVVNKGDQFTIGLAFWPSGSILNWGPAWNETLQVPGLNPCLGDVDLGNQTLNYEQFLQASGVTFSTFSVTVDTTAALHTTKAEMDSLWNSIQGTQQRQVMSVIAFRGMNRSEARYVRSNSPSDTGGTGIAEEMGLVVSFARGVFAGFSWYNYDDCVACGGLSSSECVKTTYDPVYQTVTQNTCAAPLADCTCRGLQCPADNCTTTFYATFQGSDQAGNTLTSQYEIQNISKFSVTNFFSNLFSKIAAGMPGGSSNSPGRVDNAVALGGTTEGALELAQGTQMQFVGRR